MKQIALLLVLLFILFSPQLSHAQQSQKPEFIKGKVIKVLEDGKKTVGATENIFQRVEVLLTEGTDKGKTVTVEYGGLFTLTEAQKVAQGEAVVINKTITGNQTSYAIYDIYRLDVLIYVLLGFFFLVIVIAGRKGIGSLLGMLISVAVIFLFIVPQIIQGSNPLLTSLIGSLIIMITSIYLAHGFSKETTIAVISTFISLIITIIISIFCVNFIHLHGIGSEDAISLLQSFQGKINLQGLLLGGMIIGTLGVLDDVTTTQTTTIFTLAEANDTYSVRQLFQKGMRIGREHIASLVNTLVLAYAGAATGVFIYLYLGIKQGTPPLWVMVNSELIAEEIIRTLAGSLGLILAVPITTVLAAFFAKYSVKIH